MRKSEAKSIMRILWWGRGDNGYSRNGVIRACLRQTGHEIVDFRPRTHWFADWEALLKRVATPDLVWVPCFRQRDVLAAARWARRKGVPLVFDPLISAWDKRVLEFGKVSAASSAAHRLLEQERRQFAAADVVIADTAEHARFFREQLLVPEGKLRVVYVGADERLFTPAPLRGLDGPLEVLFYGSMLPLQGPRTIVEAARLTQGEPIRWTLLGKGPQLAECREAASGLPNVVFEEPVAYDRLCERIHRADVLLGVFGTTEKAARVMPNKVFQALASGRTVVTRESAAYPGRARASEALAFVPPGDPPALADAVRRLAADREGLRIRSSAARALFDAEFSSQVIRRQVESALTRLISLQIYNRHK